MFDTFHRISEISGNASQNEKENEIVRLIQKGSNTEAKFIVRWLGKNMRTGVAEKTVLSALARAFAYTPPDLVRTPKEILNFKKKVGTARFNESCLILE